MSYKLLMLYMESVQLPFVTKKVPKDRSLVIVLVACTGLLLLLLKISGEWLAELIIKKGWIL